MKKILILLIALCFTTNIIVAQDVPCLLDDKNTDEVEVKKLITEFVKGVDKQDGEQIAKTFYEGSSIYAFAPDGKKIIKVTAEQFAKLHQDKKFGGQDRKFDVKDLTVTDGLQASANVTAYNEVVFYNYRLTFIKQDGKWLIVNMMQRSRPQTEKSK